MQIKERDKKKCVRKKNSKKKISYYNAKMKSSFNHQSYSVKQKVTQRAFIEGAPKKKKKARFLPYYFYRNQ